MVDTKEESGIEKTRVIKVIVLLGNARYNTEFLGVFKSHETLNQYLEDYPYLEDEYVYGITTVESVLI